MFADMAFAQSLLMQAQNNTVQKITRPQEITIGIFLLCTVM